ncbi:MAG TPA: ABC transporter substrate-binding protein [Usitatibacter sp.]|nr:ABC transporter substrate-binding protein [Usitatibacter sp.]
MKKLRVAALVALAVLTGAAHAARTLNAVVFPSGFNWPLWVATEKGEFAREGLEVKLTLTPGSVLQMEGLAAGKFDVGMTTIDNVVAYDEGQGEARLEAPADFFAFMGGQIGAVRLDAQPDIHSIAELKGRSLAVDAVSTGYAFVLRKLLQHGGLREGDYTLEEVGSTGKRAVVLMEGKTAATILTSPLEILPESRGFNRLVNASDVVGPYQALVGVARRSWARENADALVGFIRAYVRALAWLGDPGNRMEAVAIYRKNVPGASEEIAQRAWNVMLGGSEGFQKRAKLDPEAIGTVLALRREFGKPGVPLGQPDKYLDETYYARAVR